VSLGWVEFCLEELKSREVSLRWVKSFLLDEGRSFWIESPGKGSPLALLGLVTLRVDELSVCLGTRVLGLFGWSLLRLFDAF
jgi:hypothetical protein